MGPSRRVTVSMDPHARLIGSAGPLFPRLETARLRLRAFRLADADVHTMARVRNAATA
jgi:hypothetical protein